MMTEIPLNAPNEAPEVVCVELPEEDTCTRKHQGLIAFLSLGVLVVLFVGVATALYFAIHKGKH